MTLTGLTDISRHISNINLKIELLKVGESLADPTATIEGLKVERVQLRSEWDNAIRRLSKDDDTELCIYLFIVRGYTWRKIAQTVTGRMDTVESIKKRCQRYVW